MVKDAELEARQKELDHLKQIEKESFRSRSRYKERKYLHAVYKAHRRSPSAERKPRAMQMAELSEIAPRKNTHPLKIIIDCTSPRTDPKIRSRWAQALRYASEQKVNSDDLLDFLEEGGVARLASAFAEERAGRTKPKKGKTSLNSAGKK